MRPQILQHSGWQATMLQNHWRILFIFQQVVGTSSSVFRCHKYSFFNKICNITKCSSLWSLGHLRPLWCSQFAFKSIPQAIYNLDLPFIHWNLSMSLPEIRLSWQLYRQLSLHEVSQPSLSSKTTHQPLYLAFKMTNLRQYVYQAGIIPCKLCPSRMLPYISVS